MEADVNEALRIAMAEAGETAESLAGRIGVDPKTAAHWVNPLSGRWRCRATRPSAS